MIGKEIHRLATFDGKLYTAFGDYGANTGPIALAPLDLTSQTFDATEATLNTEQLWTWRVLDGVLHAPYVDPRGSGDASQGQLATTAGGGSWDVVISCDDPVPDHVFDVAKTADGLFLFGSSGTDALIWQSTDDGATWAVSHTVTGTSNRFYTAMTFGDVILAVAVDAATITTVTAWRWDGAAWTQISDLATIGASFIISDNPAAFTVNSIDYWLVSDLAKSTASPGSLQVGVVTLPETNSEAAAVTAALPFTSIYDACNDGAGHLYVLAGDNHLWRCDTAGEWTDLIEVAADNEARSVTIDTAGGYLWFGTADSRVCPYPIPA